MDTNLRSKVVKQLKRHEGCKPKAYKDDRGYWTIGYGRLIDDRLKSQGLSQDEMDYMLGNDVDRCERELDSLVPWWKQLSPQRQMVLLNMIFNLGVTRFMGFKNFLKQAKAGNYSQAADEMVKSNWFMQVGDGPGGFFDRAEELTDMMRNNTWGKQ